MFKRQGTAVARQAGRALAASAARPSITSAARTVAPTVSAVNSRRCYHEKDMFSHVYRWTLETVQVSE